MKALTLAMFLLLTPCAGVGAQPPPRVAIVDARAEIAATLYAASATQTAFEKSADAKLRADRARIMALTVRMRAGEMRRRGELAALQSAFVAELGDRDHAYAEAIAIFRNAVTDIASTPEGAAALARFNNGDEVGALAILDRLRAANDLVRQKRADIESAADGRRIARLALDARARGKQSTAEVIDRYEQVVKLDPNVFDDWLQLSGLYQAAGRVTDARRAIETAQRAAGTDEDRVAALSRLGVVLIGQGELDGARKVTEQSLVLTRRLIASNPSAPDLQRDLCVGLDHLAYVLFAQGDLVGAGEAYEEEVAVERRLVAANPSNPRLQRNLAVGLNETGDVLAAEGKLPPARAFEEESNAILRRLVGGDPANVGLQNDTAESLDKTGDVLVDMGDLTGARMVYEESLAAFRRVAGADPSDAGMQRNVSNALERVGLVYSNLGNHARSLTAYEESLAIDRRLAASDAGNAVLQGDIGQSLTEVGSERTARGDLVGAGRAYGESLAIFRRLVAADPTNTDLQRDLALNLDKAGRVLTAQGDSAEARDRFQESLRLSRRLSETAPGNADFRSDIAATLAAMADIPGAGVTWNDVLSQLQDMDRKGPLDAADKALLETAERHVARPGH